MDSIFMITVILKTNNNLTRRLLKIVELYHKYRVGQKSTLLNSEINFSSILCSFDLTLKILSCLCL